MEKSAPEVVPEQPVVESAAKEETYNKGVPAYETVDEIVLEHAEADLNVTSADLLQAKEQADGMTLEETRKILIQVLQIHENDPNFPHTAVEKIRAFVDNDDIYENPIKYQELIDEVKIEASLIVNNSPYAEVRAVVDNTDDPATPSSTIRAYVIGLVLVGCIAFINELFEIRQPSITLYANVVQLLCFPVGKFCEFVLPDWGFTLFGVRHSLNPGRFSKKEHMLITIMANVGASTPYTNYIIWTQVLPQFFNQSFARSFGYQILIGLSTNFIGYGLAGICRKFLVFPTYAVWPTSLVTVALNASFHTDTNPTVTGPYKSMFRISRLKFFVLAFTAMFIWFWVPNYLFNALQIFSWMTWIAPNNVSLNAITGGNSGLGVNPLSTFDWNMITTMGDPLVVPFMTMINMFAGSIISMFVIIGMWYRNDFWTGYLPINSNRVFDRFGSHFNVSNVVDSRGLLDIEKYHNYSPAYLASGNLTVYIFFFAVYTATISYTYLYHRHEIMVGFRALFKRYFKKDEDAGYTDIHNKLMSAYPEVPEWWFLIVLVCAIALGCAGLASWQTNTTVGVLFFGVCLCVLFVVPIGIITSITGVQVTLNVLAEFIGGSWIPGNALSMNFFKSYGYVTCAHAIAFSNDLKLAHYVKIPPRHTFWAQLIATLVSTFVCTGVLNFQINGIKDVCSADQPNHYTCPGVATFFTAAVLWGTLAPPRVFGTHGYYKVLLVGFPIGFVIPIIIFYAQKYFKNTRWLRAIHPVTFFYGGLNWAPYNAIYFWPAIPFSFISMVWLKKKYIGLWSKYNYVLSAAFSCGIAISGIIIFFALQYTDTSLNWWGNVGAFDTCDANACTRLTLADGESFGPGPGQFY